MHNFIHRSIVDAKSFICLSTLNYLFIFFFLRGAEILYSVMLGTQSMMGKTFPELTDALMARLVVARRNLALFQHHDGITGTARDHVVVDYANK